MCLVQAPIVSAQQMQRIESRLFENGMPVAALMEKVGGLISKRIQTLFPLQNYPSVGLLVGPGHNGADGLVVARELWFRGYSVHVYHPFTRCKTLTSAHAQFARSLSIPFHESIEGLRSCTVIIDGLFGFGLERPLEASLINSIDVLQSWNVPIVSIDIPSGLQTDTGAVLGTAVRATHTLCLGLWKLGLFQEQALNWVGDAELIDFDIPISIIAEVLGSPFPVQRLLKSQILQQLPLKRDRTTHKYRQGHLLLIGGSQQYAGSILLSALAARASGVGMLSIAVPERLKPLVVSRLPDAVILGAPETPQGAISHLPETLDLNRFDAIAYGPGATTESDQVLTQVLACDRPLILDADGLNILANLGTAQLQHRSPLTVLTPHAGEFQRLFPHINTLDTVNAAQAAAQYCQAMVVRKGPYTAIASETGQVWINTESTPALARGGSGDVLTGLMGGLMAQAQRQGQSLESAVQGAVWWHSWTGRWVTEHYTAMGANAEVLAESLLVALKDAGGECQIS